MLRQINLTVSVIKFNSIIIIIINNYIQFLGVCIHVYTGAVASTCNSSLLLLLAVVMSFSHTKLHTTLVCLSFKHLRLVYQRGFLQQECIKLAFAQSDWAAKILQDCTKALC